MGNGDDRDTGSVIAALRDAKMSDAGGDVRALIGDTLKRVTINGKGVTGGGLSFAIGNTGLGVEAGEASGTPVAEPLQRVEIAPPPPFENFFPPPIQPPQIVPPATVINQLGPPTPPAAPSFPVAEVPDVPTVQAPPTPQTLIPLQVTGAVNGVPATALIGAFAPWVAIE